MTKLSIVITTHNAEDTIVRALNSISDFKGLMDLEVIIVDDCSSDSTIQRIKSYCLTNSVMANIITISEMTKNSGSPSKPRNKGISLAKGKYITFLDDDDYICSMGLFRMLEYVCEENLDFLTGYLKVVEKNKVTVANRISEEQLKSGDIIDAITSFQSTKLDILVRTSLIQANSIKFDSSLKIGEDTVFFSEIFKAKPRVAYLDDFFCFYCKDIDVENPSSTQRYGDREILNQIQSWERTDKNYQTFDKSYYKLRLHVGYRNLLLMLVKYNKEQVTKDIFLTLHRFTIENKRFLHRTMALHNRYQEIFEAILLGDYEQFLDKIKRRLLINGCDLKFILPAVNYLKQDFNVRVDEWTGHNRHDEKQSREMINWADIVFCEWMLGNAVWYSKNKLRTQKLLIRAHRFELYTNFGDGVDINNVDRIVTVGNYYMEKFYERFNFPRHKMTIVSNYIDESCLSKEKSERYKYNLAIAGILPSRKGYLKSLELIKDLIEVDDRYKLHVIGGTPEQTDWIKNNPMEMEYFSTCEKFILDNNLSEHVVIVGYLNRDEMFQNVGYVLSLSDKEQPESFHLTPAEGVLSNSVSLLLNWPGIEYIYPKFMVFQNVAEIKKEIIELSNNDEKYEDLLSREKEYISNQYNLNLFLENMNVVIDNL